jgi:cytochrome P450
MLTISTVDEALAALLGTEAGQADPVPLYRRLHELGPVHRSGLDGVWYAVGYEPCRQVLTEARAGRTPEMLSTRFGVTPAQAGRFERRGRRPNLLNENPPVHTRLRNAARGPFLPRPVAGLAPRIAEMVDEHLERLAAARDADVMAELAFPLPVAVVGEILGVPAGDRARFGPLVWSITAADQPGAPDDLVARADEATAAIDDYFVELIKERRRRPGPDLLTQLVEARDGGELSDEELLATITLVFTAGFVTTTNLIGNGLLALLRHPAELARLASDPTLLPVAVEEMLRYDSPVQMIGRTALEPFTVAGQSVQRGDAIMVALGAANRDPVAFPDPDRFDVGRSGNQPLSFGFGIHHCLGAGLARLEGRLVFGRLLERFRMDLLDDDPPRAAGFFGRRLARLPVRFSPLGPA